MSVRDSTLGCLTPVEDLKLTTRALRAGWLCDPGLHRQALAIIGRIFSDPKAYNRDLLMAIRCLAQLEEVERRTRRDLAEQEARKERRAVSVLESVLSSPEGIASALERTKRLAEALQQQREGGTSLPAPVNLQEGSLETP